MKSVLFAGILLLSSCSSGMKKVDFPAGTDPQATVTDLRARMEMDQARQYNFLSPSNFSLADRFLSEAQDRLDQDESSESVLEDAGYAAARLQIVEQNGYRHAGELSAVLAARKAAIAARGSQGAQAEKTSSEEFDLADKDLIEVGRDIERNDFHPDEKELYKIEFKYFDVQLNSMRKGKLSSL